MTRHYLWPLSLCVAVVSGCAASNTITTSNQPPSSKIQHIVIIMQENRSFDNLFMGFPGADTVTSGMSHGTSINLQPIPLGPGEDIDHSHTAWWHDFENGAMDSFGDDTYVVPNYPYAYVPQSQTVPLWTLAERYTLADRMFESNNGPSFTSHQYMIAGQSANIAELPVLNGQVTTAWGCDSPAGTTALLVGPNGTDLPGGVYPCLDYQTIADLLDAKGLSWRYYAPPGTAVTEGGVQTYASGYMWSAFDAIRHIRFGTDWNKNVISPPPQVLTDIANGQLAQVTWIVPAGSYSDHAGSNLTAEGPDWVATITNAIGASPFWDSTAIFISWDDWGGWYDHVPPPQIDKMGLGYRVPLIIVSPYAKNGYVSHVQHEFGGFLKYTEELFNLPSLGTRDAMSDDFSDCFDYSQTPQPYIQVPVKFDGNFFLYNKDTSPPDND